MAWILMSKKQDGHHKEFGEESCLWLDHVA